MILQPIVDLAELLYRQGIRDVVISPGSRSAPLTLAVVRHGRLRVRAIADERSAGFVALGLAQQSGRAVAIVCTSGSAVYNLAPAVAEAYFQEIPLLLLTADRPREWLGQQDGQTISQFQIFGAHVKRSFDLPADYSHADARWAINRMANEGVLLSQTAPAGPVHLNVPLREPFYPEPDEEFWAGSVRIIEQLPATPALPAETWHRLLDEWEGAERKLIVAGQYAGTPARLNATLATTLQRLSSEYGVPVVSELPGNLHRNGQFVTFSDTLLGVPDSAVLESLRPDLLITFGGSLLTRNLKTFLRRYPAKHHWHIQPHTERLPDPFQSLTTLIPAQPGAFFEKLFADLDYQRFREGDPDDANDTYYQRWRQADDRAGRLVAQMLQPDGPFTDWLATQIVLDALPDNSILHLANSMPVRYANLCGIDAQRNVAVQANRGVSGIDGCLSTAVGAALATDKLVTLFIGDVAFFYDRNGLWHEPLPANLRIVLFNNAGGHIFRMIDGSNRQPELEPFFETPHHLTAERTAQDFNVEYHESSDLTSLTTVLMQFFARSERPKLLEIHTDRRLNAEQFKGYKAALACP